uniref:Uncharacterized protein n=1 Tax=Romanomermis culicivorax TaxID=13658 RepID=A0A915KIL9_ROMCU
MIDRSNTSTPPAEDTILLSIRKSFKCIIFEIYEVTSRGGMTEGGLGANSRLKCGNKLMDLLQYIDLLDEVVDEDWEEEDQDDTP